MTAPGISVLFVCLGNICRSPTAEAVFRHKANLRGMDLHIDSAGTMGYHTGSPPDPRSQQAGEARGYSFEGLACRRVKKDDFVQFDYVIAMDEENLSDLNDASPEEHRNKIHLLLAFADQEEKVVPDPYYGGKKGFEYVLDLIEQGSDGLLDHIVKTHN